MPKCVFCNLLPIQIWYYLTDKYKVLDCPICNDQVVIWTAHGDPTYTEQFQMEDTIAKTLNKTFTRKHRLKHPLDHWYEHLK